jgi:C4-type Zn-finger protein
MSNNTHKKHPDKKEVGRQPLCPFCGSPKVYPIREKRLFFFTRVIAWSCANENCRMYRKYFPNPSWGRDT